MTKVKEKIHGIPHSIIFLSLFIFIALVINIKTPFSSYDEGFAVFAAKRILYGDIPYKDFWTTYPPGEFFLIAFVFKIFGTNLMVSRIFDILQRALILLCVYKLTKRVTTKRLTFYITLGIAIILASAGYFSYAGFTIIGLSLSAIYCWQKYKESSDIKWLTFSGTLIGIGLLIRWDVSIYTLISILLAEVIILVNELRNTTMIKNTQQKSLEVVPSISKIKSKFKVLLRIIIPAMMISFFGYVTIGIMAGFKSIFDQIFLFPIFKLHNLRWLPLPPLIPIGWNWFDLNWRYFYFAIIVLFITFCYFTFLGIRSINNKKDFFPSSLIISLFILCLFLLLQALNRIDYIHSLPAAIIALIIFSYLVHLIKLNLTPKNISYIINSLLIFSYIFYFLPGILQLTAQGLYNPPCKCFSSIVNAACVQLSEDQENAIKYIQENTASNEFIFVGNQVHDQITFNDIGFYFLADRRCATRFHELHTGVATTLPIQMEIVNEIKLHNVNWIILVDFNNVKETNTSGKSSGVVYLDNFIRSTYELITAFGKYSILKKK